MRLIFEQVRTGGDRNFGYLLADRDAGEGVLIDPSYSPDALVERATEQRIRIRYIVNTHGHPDHVNGNDRAVALTGAAVAAHPALPAGMDVRLEDGQELPVGGLLLQIFFTPGHADDHVVIHESSSGVLVTGDLLFVGKVGGTPSDDAARAEWDSLQRVIASVPPETTVWPGHDYGVRPSSTVQLERQTNPFLQCRGIAEFLQLKRDWPAFKKQYGLK
jgi:glyoxylase-like metal-dependent hydrolase (beta-lactamase superfamily II)